MAAGDGDPERSAAAQVNRDFRATVDDIRANPSFSNDGRRIEIAKAWVSAETRLAELRTKYSAAAQADIDAAEAKAFGPPGPKPAPGADTIARDANYRDAIQRAQAVDRPEALGQLLRLAHRTQDPLFEHAIAVVAAGHNWTRVLAVYSELRPDRAQAIADYSAIAADYRRPNLNLRNQFVFHVQKPTEIDGRSPAQIQALADGKLTPSGGADDR